MIRTAVLAALLLGGTALAADMPRDEKSFAAKLHKDNQMEIELGKLAQQKASSQSVKEFAQTMVTDHQKADQELQAMAQARKWKLAEPPASNAKAKAMKQSHSALKAKLQALDGPMFDQSYMAAMVEDHDHAVTKVAKAAQQFQGSDFGQKLTQMLPTLQKHRADAYRILGEVKADPAKIGVGGAGETGTATEHDRGKGHQGPGEPAKSGDVKPADPKKGSGR